MPHDILFIHPGNQKRNYQDLSSEFTAIATPAWTVLLASAIREKGYKTAIYDVNVSGWDDEVAFEILSRHQPRLIVILVYGHNPSASTQTMPAARKIAQDLKSASSEIPIVFGGTHPSALPERTMREEPVDFVVQGEGLYTLLDLLAYFGGRSGITSVRGLWYRAGDDIVSNEPAPLVQDLDKEFSTYGWDLLPDLGSYRAHNMHSFQYFQESTLADFSDVRSPYVAMNTSLGCPYSCHYCCTNSLFGKPGVRYWSVEKVVSWIDELVTRYHVRNIRFEDELFLLSADRVDLFCDAIIERGYNLNIWVYGRVDTINYRLLDRMRRAGITWVCLGIESGSAIVRKSVNKRISSDIVEVVRSIQDSGMYVLGNYMFGLPEDNLETMQETLDLACRLNTEFANFYSVMAYPGSKLYEWASGLEGVLPETWEGYSQHSYIAQPLSTKYLTARQVLKFRDEAFDKYHKNPAYLETIENKFGRSVVKHLEKMLSVKIRRQLLENI